MAEAFGRAGVRPVVIDALQPGALATANAGLLFIDDTHATAVERAYGADRFAYIGFCPHAAIGEAQAPDPDPQAFFERRPIPILFSGSIFGPGPRPWADFDDVVRQIHDAAFDIAMAEEWQPPHDAEAAFALARAGQATVRKQHAWDHRVPIILEAADQVRARLADRA